MILPILSYKLHVCKVTIFYIIALLTTITTKKRVITTFSKAVIRTATSRINLVTVLFQYDPICIFVAIAAGFKPLMVFICSIGTQKERPPLTAYAVNDGRFFF